MFSRRGFLLGMGALTWGALMALLRDWLSLVRPDLVAPSSDGRSDAQTAPVGQPTTQAAPAPQSSAPTSPSAPTGPPAGPPLLKIALLADPHIIDENSVELGRSTNRKLERALQDLGAFAPDLWILNGDITDMGLAPEYRIFKDIMKKYGQGKPYYGNTGNHSFYDGKATDAESVARFNSFFEQERAYRSVMAAGLHLVLLSGEIYKAAPQRNEWAWLSRQQVEWFGDILAQRRTDPTVVFLHQPMQNTVIGSQQPSRHSGVGEFDQLTRILAANPQVRLWLSGHTHRSAAMAGQVLTQGSVTFAGTGGIFSTGGSPAQNGGAALGFRDASESRWLELYGDRLVLRARNHAGGGWWMTQYNVQVLL